MLEDHLAVRLQYRQPSCTLPQFSLPLWRSICMRQPSIAHRAPTSIFPAAAHGAQEDSGTAGDQPPSPPHPLFNQNFIRSTNQPHFFDLEIRSEWEQWKLCAGEGARSLCIYIMFYLRFPHSRNPLLFAWEYTHTHTHTHTGQLHYSCR